MSGAWAMTEPAVRWLHESSLGAVGDHLLERHHAASEIAHGLHVIERNSVGLPLRYGTACYAEVCRQVSGTPLLCFEPRFDVHAPSLDQSKPKGQAIPKRSLFSIDFTMENARRRRFVAYFTEVLSGDRAKLTAKTRLTKGRITQLFDADESFGERAARSLAVRLGLAPDYFERDAGATPLTSSDLSDEEQRVIAALRAARPASSPAMDESPRSFVRRIADEHRTPTEPIRVVTSKQPASTKKAKKT